MRRLLPGNAVQDPPDLRYSLRRGSGILNLLVVLYSEVLLQIGLSDADAPAHADCAQLARLDVSAHGDRVQLQPIRHVADGQ